MSASVRPLIHIHDLLDQQAEALELGEVQVFHRLIEAAVDPFAAAFLKDGEVLIECLAPDAVSDSVLMQELSGLKLQTHRGSPTSPAMVAHISRRLTQLKTCGKKGPLGITKTAREAAVDCRNQQCKNS